ncbi:MAG: class I tRNA ligase family protein, partial [Acetobacteraceae bacterium]
MVLSDRFADSTLAYQCFGLGLPRVVWDRLAEVTLEGLRPDLTVVLDVPVGRGLERAAARGGNNHYEALPQSFHERVRAGFHAIAADVLARWKRLEGKRVFFLTGTDEHGQKVEKAARDAGEAPRPFTDRVSQAFRDLTGVIGLSNDDFIRTTEDRHYAACQALWQRLVEAGDIYLGHYEGWYAVRDEAFYGPDELTERDGVMFAPSGAPVEWVREPSYFFRLSRWLPELLRRYDLPDGDPDRIAIAPETRKNEVVAFIRQGMKDFAATPEKLDLSVSRTSFRWGVPVPGDPGHVMYVWLDALTNYITAVGYPSDQKRFAEFWPADLHMVGKDIVRFHTIYWPAFLMAAGI